MRAVEELDLKRTARTQDFAATALIANIEAPAPMGPALFVNYLSSCKRGLEYERELQAVTTAAAIERHLSEQSSQVGITTASSPT
jgi:hypothetical protein